MSRRVTGLDGRERPANSIVVLRGRRYRIDLHAIEHAYIVGVGRERWETRSDLARVAGVSTSSLSRLIQGRQTSPRTLAAVLRALGQDFDAVVRSCE